MGARKGRLRQRLEAMSRGDTITEDASDIGYIHMTRIQSIANHVRREDGRMFAVRWDRPARAVHIKRVV